MAGSGITRSGSGTVGDPYTYSVASAFVNRPVNYVSFWDACRFVNWINNEQPTGPQNASTTEDGSYTLNGYVGSDGRTIQRNPGARWVLPSEGEWYKAAYHKNDGLTGSYWDYPTETNAIPGRDTSEATNTGNNANYNCGTTPIDPPFFTTIVGEFQLSDSPYGTFDQGGNLWEWNETIISQNPHYAFRGMRGASFSDSGFGLKAATRLNADPVLEEFVGFRVVFVPEPCSALLVLIGSLAAVVRRRPR